MTANEIKREPIASILSAYMDNECVRMLLRGEAYTDGNRFYNILSGGWFSINRPDLLGVNDREEARALLVRLYDCGFSILNASARRIARKMIIDETRKNKC